MSLLTEAYDLLGVLNNAQALDKTFLLEQRPRALDLMHRIVAAEAEQCEIDCARDTYGSDEVEIDDDAITSRMDGGSWVSAWVWISDEEMAVHNECQFEVMDLEDQDDE